MKLPIEDIKENKHNPRKIDDVKFDKLVKSITEFPQMLEVRPLVVDEHNVVLGGNMRLKALKQAGFNKVEVKKVEGWTEEQKKEFIVKDNVAFGSWDWDKLANIYDNDELVEWGFDESQLGIDTSKPNIDTDDYSENLDSYVEGNIKQIVLYFASEEYENIIARMEKIMQDKDIENHTLLFIEMLNSYEKQN